MPPGCGLRASRLERLATGLDGAPTMIAVLDCFICHRTGVKLDEGNDSSPWFLNHDHIVPEKGGDLVVAANFINVMKSELAEGEFRAVVLELDRHLRTGEPFRKDITGFKHWHGLSRARR